ncbi:MAG: phosphate ABC transporter permease subunit PstC [Candidatus Dormibacteria bacterium]
MRFKLTAGGTGGNAGPTFLTSARTFAGADLTARDRAVRWVLLGAGLVPTLMLLFLTAEMVREAIPAFVYSGWSLFTGHVFTFGNLYVTKLTVHHGVSAPHGAAYGALPFIFGTLVSSLIALVVAVPVAVGAVMALTERVPARLQPGLSVFFELLAGMPSVVYGFWGILVFGPLLAKHVFPVLAHLGGLLPFFSGSVGYGEGLLTASLVLAIMIIPIIAATTRELVRTVPILAKEGALALGMTQYETAKVVTLPYVRRGILAAAILGWARALGETMAVLMISGDLLNGFPANIYSPFSSIAATIVAMLDSALTDATGMAIHALAAIGVILLVITLATNLLGRLIIRRVSHGVVLPIGRGV